MPKLKIASLGFDSADENIDYIEFDSNHSLLDYDIIMIRPETTAYYASYSSYQGKPCLSDDASFHLVGNVEHWRREIKDAVEGGKTVIVFMGEKRDVFVATGENRYSGTGRNRQTTRIVAPSNNYALIPLPFNFISSSGSSMVLSNAGSEPIAEYWRKFEQHSRYRVFIEGKDVRGHILTKNGSRKVGAIYRSPQSNGAVVLLPDIDMDNEDFTQEDDASEEMIWSKEGQEFFLSLTNAVVSIDKAIKSTDERTPEPDWVKSDKYRLNEEIDTRNRISEIDKHINKMRSDRESLENKLFEVSSLRGLLFEKGKPLEKAILQALRTLGYMAEGFNDGTSEFDAVFSAAEGRLIGEAEGKDNKPINITKLRQLSLNVHEDLERDAVETPAKGVLFGNAFRLTPLSERENPFTDKCLSACVASGIALVSTIDLFFVAKYLSENDDPDFAHSCRAAILNGIGRVEFPEIPANGQTDASPEPLTLVETEQRE